MILLLSKIDNLQINKVGDFLMSDVRLLKLNPQKIQTLKA